ncbi:uncharacterized protein LOC106175614 [Lingula anatina]|uniref:Uncharacterized protein LOC106175614 n=1 Tax=Lingula anatina TaxID=7574 RepID=A0A1S3JS54_LINAN|nr:uncharacterized protein LOC106175614 [Lingula anatina]|eukprot:XP_013413157.1 uncharacterized protein LOC106175614 [Lingula anatina]
MGTSYYSHGGGSNYLCLPRDPSWLNYTDGFQTYARMYGVEYEVNVMPDDFFSKQNIPPGIKSLHDQDAVCAVCHTPGRPTQLMIPAKTSCPGDWLMEYKGYLMAESKNHQRSEYICVDEVPEIDSAGMKDQNGGLLYNVEAVCGSLPCPNYVDGRELACVVCTL